MHTTLIDCATLSAMLGTADLVIVDCRFDLTRPEWGGQAFREGHIPGSGYAHLDRDLSGAVTTATGRHPLPDPDVLAGHFACRGIDGRVQVVAYDQGSGACAARLWWLLRWLGHAGTAVLDGGFEAWCHAGLPVRAGAAGSRAPRAFQRRTPIGAAPVSTAEVVAGLRNRTLRLIDARGADRFAGQNEIIDPVAGHVPGAVNHPFADNLGPDGRFLQAAELRARWLRTLGGHSPADTVSMCGSGVTACHNLFALELAGLTGARLYPGSWSEWIRDSGRPVATGSG